ncbi:MAG: bifunctional nuclease family protein [Candidatus Aminicenantes bacterium]|nr:bifunctional nuclease family protein [Candidatus Aminicenantes bacterium]
MDIEMKVRGLVVDPMSKMPIVLLEDASSERVLPIWIGVFEANAIALVIENIDTPRPMTHDLFKNMLDKAGIVIDKVVVNDVQNNTFYALIHCQHQGRRIVIDSRPSDAIALALRMKSPIYVRDEVVKLSHSLKLDENLETSEKIMKWLESLRPEDLGKYKM